MSSCCTVETPSLQSASLCPHCQQKSKSISFETLKSQLTPLAMRRILVDSTFYFCAHPSCPIVYFSQTQTFKVEEIREKVFQKNKDADCPVCYCFGHTRAEVERDAYTQAFQIISQIKVGIKNKQCACELRNPQGRCCLGNVSALQQQTLKKASTE